jgi:hypothetical protein
MTQKKQTKGICAYCGAAFTRNGMTRHLESCPQRLELIADAETGKQEALYHLRVQDAYNSDYWLDLELAGSVKLEKLDYYLREIWLECCGHLSEFMTGGRGYGDELPMSRRIGQVFEPGTELTHIYDWGTSSITKIKMVGMRDGRPITKRPVAMMARNLMPEAQCLECERPATHLCIECLIEEDVWGVLCDEHARTHQHTDYGEPIKLVNSPRIGMCGYTGPADPPY